MWGTMQHEQLSLATLLRYASTFRGEATVSTWTGESIRSQTFREIGSEAARLAHALRGLGVQTADRVGTFMWNNNEHMVAFVAIPAMGAVLHTLNIRLSPDQLTYVANHAADRVVIVDGSLAPVFAQYLPKLTTVQHVIITGSDTSQLSAPVGVQVHSYTELLAGQPDSYDFPVLDERSASGLCYTSGTTGDPKGVLYTHRSNWLHAMEVISPNALGFTQADTVLTIVPMFHANAWGIPYGALMSGANLLLPDRFLQPAPLLEIMAAAKPTLGAAVPTIWSGVQAALEARPQDISHLRTVVVGGAALPPSMMHAFQENHGVRLVHAWGMTETSPVGSVAHPPAGLSGDREWAYRYTQGRFSAAVQARLVGEDDTVLPNDGKALGELEVRGPWIAGAYYAPEGTTVDPDKFHEGWLRTGDIARISPDGFLTLVDRAKDVIKSGGEWISSVDLENMIMGHPAVSEATVIAVPDEKWDERPLVAVVLIPGAEVTPIELRGYLADHFAKWQLPEHWTFVAEIPKTSVGKFDKKRLRALYAAGELTITTLS
ncbi:long-chain fatty acid--CoA ligase [Nocardia sp. NPDC052112]|uniref:long-chain fatty acid--CoA ligase n=1 Tax=Nocardia sp. NPDC052112 TaxID=3155646 RepID=UPI0034349BA5